MKKKLNDNTNEELKPVSFVINQWCYCIYILFR